MALEIADEYTFDAPREAIWPSIFDPRELVRVVPGCESLEQTGDDEYRGVLRLGIAAVGGTYQTVVRVLETTPPSFCRMQGDISGAPGALVGEAQFRLEEVDGKTRLTYEGQATITGALGRMSPRLIEGVARSLIKQGLARLEAMALAAHSADQSP